MMTFLRKYAEAATIDFSLFEIDGIDFRTDAASATGDITLNRDEAGAEQLDADAFVDEGTGYSLVISSDEMTAKRIHVHIVDQTSPKAWLDTGFIVETYGHASAMHVFDLDSATVTITNLADASAGKLDDILDGTGGTGLKVSTLEVTSTTTLTGAVSLGSTLGITGAVTLSSTLATGAATFASATVTGALTTGSIVNSGVFTQTGNVALSGTYTVDGVSTLTGAVTYTGGIVADITGNLSGSVASVSGAVGSVGTGGITAASIADAAIDNATFASDVGSTAYATNIIALAADKAILHYDSPTAQEVADAVWDELSTGHVSAGKAGQQLWTDVDAILDDTGNAGVVIADGYITAAKIGADAITSAKIADNAIAAEHIAAAAIDNATFAADVGSTAYATNIIALAANKALANYDPPTNTEMDAAFTAIKGATWATTDTLEAIRDAVDSDRDTQEY